MLGTDGGKLASAITDALAQGFAQSATRQRASVASDPAATKALPPGLPPGTVVSDKGVPQNEGEGWLSRRELWGLPNWQFVTGGSVVGAVLWRLLRGRWGL